MQSGTGVVFTKNAAGSRGYDKSREARAFERQLRFAQTFIAGQKVLVGDSAGGVFTVRDVTNDARVSMEENHMYGIDYHPRFLQKMESH